MPSPITRRTFLGTSMGVLASLALYGCGSSNTIPTEDTGSTDEQKASEATEGSPVYDDGKSNVITAPIDNGYSSGLHHATIEVKDYGKRLNIVNIAFQDPLFIAALSGPACRIACAVLAAIDISPDRKT